MRFANVKLPTSENEGTEKTSTTKPNTPTSRPIVLPKGDGSEDAKPPTTGGEQGPPSERVMAQKGEGDASGGRADDGSLPASGGPSSADTSSKAPPLKLRFRRDSGEVTSSESVAPEKNDASEPTSAADAPPSLSSQSASPPAAGAPNEEQPASPAAPELESEPADDPFLGTLESELGTLPEDDDTFTSMLDELTSSDDEESGSRIFGGLDSSGQVVKSSKPRRKDRESTTGPQKVRTALPVTGPLQEHNSEALSARQESKVLGGSSEESAQKRESSFGVANGSKLYEVKVPLKRGGETAAKSSLRMPGTDESLSEELAGSVVDAQGEEQWRVRGRGKSKISSAEAQLFLNLNRRAEEGVSDPTLREIFARVDAEQLTPEELLTRKRLVTRAVFGSEADARRGPKRFSQKDLDVLRFLGKFKYANSRHLSQTLACGEDAALKRLGLLKQRGLVVKRAVYGARPLWLLTEAGLILSGLSVPRTKWSNVSYSLFPHQFVVNHVASNLWSGNFNVFGLPGFLGDHRRTETGRMVLGEELVSETEVQSAFALFKRGEKAEVYRNLLAEKRLQLLRDWEQLASDERGPSPELLPGNEWCWALTPPASLRLSYHIPDLVIARPRGTDGRPKSIAVEIELANKAPALYERALNAYRFDDMLYDEVIWVVKSEGAASKLNKLRSQWGREFAERVKIVPILTVEGVFKGRAEWTL